MSTQSITGNAAVVAAVPEQQTHTFENVTVYQKNIYGEIYRTDVRRVTVSTGVKHAQYDNAISVAYLLPRKRKPYCFLMSHRPWLVILSREQAIEPDAGFLSKLEHIPVLFRVDREDEED